MKDPIELRRELDQFIGTVNYYRNPLYPWMLYTDGVKFFADNAANGAHWLLDIVGTEYRHAARVAPFLVIRLVVADDRAVIFCEDGNGIEEVKPKRIACTDCPNGEWSFYLTGGVLMLPSEY